MAWYRLRGQTEAEEHQIISVLFLIIYYVFKHVHKHFLYIISLIKTT